MKNLIFIGSILFLMKWGIFNSLFAHKISSHIFYYTIQKGDSLSQIKSIFAISKTELEKYNSPKNLQHFYTNTVLKIPLTNERKVISHLVKKGESLYSLKKIYHLNLNVINAINQVQGKKLHAGEILFIPITHMRSKSTPSFSTEKKPSSKNFSNVSQSHSTTSYTIQKTDTFFSLAHRFHMSIKHIQQIYGRKILLQGTTIHLPKEAFELAKKQQEKISVLPQQKKFVSFNSSIIAPIPESIPESYSPLVPGKIFHTNAQTGFKIFSPANGEIINIQPFYLFGTALFLQNHDGVIILTSRHFSIYYVKKHALVKQGQLIVRVDKPTTIYFFYINTHGKIINPS